MNRDRDHFAERWLNEALARYSDAEPRDGFEGRILANLASQRQESVSMWRRFLWMPAACAAALALVVSITLLRPATKKQPVVAPVATVTDPAPIETPNVDSANAGHPTQTAIAKPRRVRATQPVLAKASQPRKPQFPTPMPPTQQEQLLAAYLSATPEHELLAVAADQQQWREQVRKNAEAAEQEPARVRDINHLQFSPPEGGSTEAGAYGAR